LEKVTWVKETVYKLRLVLLTEYGKIISQRMEKQLDFCHPAKARNSGGGSSPKIT
jgi:hypothetical protein